MPNPNRTKLVFAEALTLLMKKTPLDEITINDITSACGYSRHSFYYHFKDKQDLVCWIFDHEIAQTLKRPPQEDISAGKRTFFIQQIIYHMYEKKSFYINALNSNAQNSLQEHLYEYIRDFREVQITALLNGRSLDPKGREFLADYFTCAINGMIIRWAKGGMRNPPDVFYSSYMNIAYQSMLQILDEYAIP